MKCFNVNVMRSNQLIHHGIFLYTGRVNLFVSQVRGGKLSVSIVTLSLPFYENEFQKTEEKKTKKKKKKRRNMKGKQQQQQQQ